MRLLPFKFNNPIKVAEQAAVLDIMSNGRVDLGTGRSTTAQELDGFGVDYERTRAEVREALDIIVKAWTDDILEYNGKLIKIPAAPRGAEADSEAASADVDGVRRARQLPDGGRSRARAC